MNPVISPAGGAAVEKAVRRAVNAGAAAARVGQAEPPGRWAVPTNCRVPVRVMFFASLVLLFYLVAAGVYALAKSGVWGALDPQVLAMFMAIVAWPLLLFIVPILVVLEVAVVVSGLVIFHRERVSLGFPLLSVWHGMLFLLD